MSNFDEDGFVESLQGTGGLQPRPIASYVSDLRQFSRWLEPRGLSMADVSIAVIQEYLDALANLGRKPSSQRRAASAIRRYRAYVEAPLGRWSKRDLQLPSIDEVYTRSLSPEQITALRSSVQGTRALDTRNIALVELLYGLGLRLSELINLKVDDVVLTEEIMRPIGQHGRARVIPIGGEALKWMRKWIDDDRRKYLTARGVENESRFVFVNRNGEKLARQTIWRMLNSAARRSRIEGMISPHTIRDSCARHMMENGATRKEVDEIFGHISFAGMPKNTKAAVVAMREVLLRTHPSWNMYST